MNAGLALAKRRASWVTVMFTEDQFDTAKLAIQACLEAGGDTDRLMPVMVQILEAEKRYAELKMKVKLEDGD